MSICTNLSDWQLKTCDLKPPVNEKSSDSSPFITTLQKGIFCPFSGLASFLPMLLLFFLFARFFLQLLLGDNIFFLCVANVANVRLERNLFSCLLWRSPVGWILTFWRKSGPCLFYIDENPSQLHISCWYTRFGLPRFLHVKAQKISETLLTKPANLFPPTEDLLPIVEAAALFDQSPSNVRSDTPLPVIFGSLSSLWSSQLHQYITLYLADYVHIENIRQKSSLILSAPCHQNLSSY